MSLKRKDVRVWLDPHDHTRLTILCRRKNMDLGEYLAQVAVPVIRSCCDDASEIEAELRKAGISRSTAESPPDQDDRGGR